MPENISYFAIGSMMNPTSMRLRDLEPELSRPAILIDFKVTFRGPNGMAFAAAEAGGSWEGVLHSMSPEDMDKLDKIELGYMRSPATCRLYDGKVVPCVVYTQNPELLAMLGPEMGQENPPTERYVDIIIGGMRAVGVKQEAIDRLTAMPSQPRKTAAEFEKLEVPPGAPAWTMQQFWDEAAAGRLLSILNGKVSEYMGPREGPLWERVEESKGKDMTFEIARNLYEPLYGLPSCLEDMCLAHRAFAEDLMASASKMFPGISAVVAIISDYPPAPDAVVHKVVFVRHGESQWNAANIFAGWHDVDLSDNGVAEAVEAGQCLKQKGFRFDIVFTSVLRRAIRTAWTVCAHSENFAMPIVNSWRLNERHYGGLQGMNKAETAATHGDDQVKIWRRSFDVPPPQLERSDPRHPCNDPLYASVPQAALPGSESLQLTLERVLPVWNDHIAPCVMAGNRVMVAAHDNSLRAICMYLKGMTEKEVLEFNIPTAVPLVYELDRELNFMKDYYLMDKAEVAAKAAAVANQREAK